jgi:hypothetical protein
MQNVIRAVNQVRNLKPYTPQAYAAKPKPMPRVEARVDSTRKETLAAPTTRADDGDTGSILTRSWNWLRSFVMEEERIVVGSAPSKGTIPAETTAKKADEVIIVKNADLKIGTNITATSDKLPKEMDDAETSPKKVDEVIVVSDADLKMELVDAKKASIEDLVESYNEVVLNGAKSEDFAKQHELTRIGVINADERAGNDNIKPIFGASPNGEFYAIAIEQDHRTTYVVMPEFGLIFSEARYRRGGLGYVFHCSDDEIEREGGGNMILVKRPAVFEPDEQKEIWRLLEKGEISLDQVTHA